MMVDVNGSLVPAPGAVALLGLAGLTARRRRA
jgi:MYXO-CTERM domain-containing protein